MPDSSGAAFARDISRERELTASACARLAIDPEPLQELAEARAGTGPVQTADRDLIQEGAEEAADWRNYLCWALQQLLADDDDAPTVNLNAALELHAALGLVAQAHAHIVDAQQKLELAA